MARYVVRTPGVSGFTTSSGRFYFYCEPALRTCRSFRAFSWVPTSATLRPRLQLRQGSVAFGPQHPAAHGILRLQLQLSGEVLRWIDPQFGFLHRGTEKLMEGRNLLQSLPYFDRFDYVANLFQEHAFCLASESLARSLTPLAASVQLFRTLFDEISRVLNHLLTLSATALDLSVMGPIFWAFEEREALMEVCERASGARMHTALYRPFGFDQTALSTSVLRDLAQFLTRCSRSLAGAFLGLLSNRSFKSRLSFVGQLGMSRVVSYGVTGLTSRSSGLVNDLRLQARTGYGLYRMLALRVFLGRRGDNLDRFLIRVKETAEGFRLLSQLVYLLVPGFGLRSAIRPAGPFCISHSQTPLVWYLAGVLRFADCVLVRCVVTCQQVTWSVSSAGLQPKAPQVLDLEQWPQRGKFVSMEALISHFRTASEGWGATAGFTYASVESPKGEVGVTLVNAGGAKPVRLKLRTPVSHNMHLIPSVGVGATFADFVATFCSLDIVMGEIDR